MLGVVTRLTCVFPTVDTHLVTTVVGASRVQHVLRTHSRTYRVSHNHGDPTAMSRALPRTVVASDALPTGITVVTSNALPTGIT